MSLLEKMSVSQFIEVIVNKDKFDGFFDNSLEFDREHTHDDLMF